MADEVLDAVAALATPHELIACDPDLADTAAFCEAYGYELDDSANTIVVVGKSKPPVFVACIVLASTRLDVNGEVRRRLGVRKASFASGEQTADITGMTIGGVTPFGLPPDMAVWVDAAVLERESVVLGGGTRHRKIVAAPSILTDMSNVEIVEGLARLIYH